MKGKKDFAIADKPLVHDVRQIIEETGASVAAAVNTGLTMLYWRIGRRINQDTKWGQLYQMGSKLE